MLNLMDYRMQSQNFTFGPASKMLQSSANLNVETPIDLSYKIEQKCAKSDIEKTRKTFEPPNLSPSTITSDSSCDKSYSIEERDNVSPKLPRPFKAYPSDPLKTVDPAISSETIEKYAQFRSNYMSQIKAQCTNPRMRRNAVTGDHPRANDPDYWEKRRKNNEAAKRSRDARRAKEDELALKCAFFERENGKLRLELQILKEQLKMLGLPF